jgi:hypothetical protein
MITTAQQNYIEEYAYVPEHMIPYVTAISQTEPFLLDDHLVYTKKGHLIFVGYPLKEPFDEGKMVKTFEDAVKHFRPREAALTAPAIPPSLHIGVYPSSDHYYRLDLSTLSMSQKLRNMLKRASRELVVERGQIFSNEHKKMVSDFVETHPVDKGTRLIFERIQSYLSSSARSWVFNARNKGGELVAFDVVELGSKHYALYMFNFTSTALYIPGASDLLLSEVIRQAKTEGKRYLNLGLGINPGVAFFKKKWGGVIFLPYAFCMVRPSSREVVDTLLQKL